MAIAAILGLNLNHALNGYGANNISVATGSGAATQKFSSSVNNKNSGWTNYVLFEKLNAEPVYDEFIQFKGGVLIPIKRAITIGIDIAKYKKNSKLVGTKYFCKGSSLAVCDQSKIGIVYNPTFAANYN